MKCRIISLLLISFISIAFATNTIKVTKKVKTKGAGNSWSSGFNCDIQISCNGASFSKQATGAFYPTKLEKPTTPTEAIGLVFDLTRAPGQDLAKHMTNVSGNQYYFPFRWANGQMSWENPYFNNKSIQWGSINDEKQSCIIKVLLPYALTTSYINEDELKKICSLHNKSVVSTKNTLSQFKTAAINYATIRASREPIFKSASAANGNLEASLKQLNDQNAAKKAEIDAAKKDLEEKQKKLDEITPRLAAEAAKVTDYTNKINSLVASKKSLEAINKELGTKSTLTPDGIAKLNTEITKAKSEFDNDINKLKTLAPEAGAAITAAAEAIAKLETTKIQEEFNKFIPK